MKNQTRNKNKRNLCMKSTEILGSFGNSWDEQHEAKWKLAGECFPMESYAERFEILGKILNLAFESKEKLNLPDPEYFLA